jgi:hypothetical protein
LIEAAIESISAQEDIRESGKSISARFSAESSGLESRIWEIRGESFDTDQTIQTGPIGVFLITFLFVIENIIIVIYF